MEQYPDTLPTTKMNRQFPMGDIGLSHKIGAIDRWVEEKGGYGAGQLGNYLGRNSQPRSIDREVIHKNHTAAVELSKTWDERHGEFRLAAIGFAITRAFTNDIPSILPAFGRDMTDVLDEMRTQHPINARTFGRFAWAGMQFSHPALGAQFDKIITEFQGRFGLYEEGRKEQFLAGLTLPYVMATYTRMEGYYTGAKVTGIRDGSTEELEAMDFSRIFTRDN